MARAQTTTAAAAAGRTTAVAVASPTISTTSATAATSSPSAAANRGNFASSSSSLVQSGTIGSAGVQTVPTGAPVTDTTESTKSSFPVAAGAAIGVVAGLIALFAAYRTYRWWSLRKQRQSLVLPGPDAPVSRPPMTSIGTTGPFGGNAYDSAGSIASRAQVQRPVSTLFPQTSEFGETASYFGGVSGAHAMARPVSMASYGPLGTDSMPNTPGHLRDSSFPSSASLISRDHSSMSTDQLRALHGGSRQSLRLDTSLPGRASPPTARSSALGPDSARRSLYAMAPSSPNRASHRMSGAPHAAHSRVEINLPAPLAPPPGSVVATSRATLDFSSAAGIGTSTDAAEWIGTAGVADPAGSPPRGRAHGRDLSAGSSSLGGPFRDPSSSGSNTAAPTEAGSDNDEHGDPAAPSSPLDKLQRQLAEEAFRRGQASIGSAGEQIARR